MPWGKNERGIVFLTDILAKDGDINEQEALEVVGIIRGFESIVSRRNWTVVLGRKKEELKRSLNSSKRP